MHHLFHRPQQRAVRVANFISVSALYIMSKRKKRNRPIAIRRLIRHDEDDNVPLLILCGVEYLRQEAPQPPVDMGYLVPAAAVMPVVADIGRNEVVLSDRIAVQVAAQFTQRPYMLDAIGRV